MSPTWREDVRIESHTGYKVSVGILIFYEDLRGMFVT